MLYTVTIDQQREWEGVIEAESPEEAVTAANLEATLDTIVYQDSYCVELHEE